MKQFDVIIKDPMGIHARPATMIYSVCNAYKSQVKLQHKGREVFGQDVLAVMGLHVVKGDLLHITVDGSDESETIEKLMELFEEINGEFE
ncbi:MAG: HPr family phosphocarrier protein [Lachnospiraceae bacterium]|nr:HPr family phosphocarrier protein [Lachnospiraceae bacterium]